MVNKLIGKKVGMTRYFLGEGASVPATVLKVGPCVVTQKKTPDKEGYAAIQVGFEPQKPGRMNRPLRGHLKALGEKGFVYLREIRVDDAQAFELGQEIKSDIFQVGDRVSVAGSSKGRGFAGVVKRWGFSGGRKSHGSRFHRAPGSIGTNTTPGRVLKGRKLPGRMGNHRVTVKNLLVIDVRPEWDVVIVKGAVPGSKNCLLEVSRG